MHPAERPFRHFGFRQHLVGRLVGPYDGLRPIAADAREAHDITPSCEEGKPVGAPWFEADGIFHCLERAVCLGGLHGDGTRFKRGKDGFDLAAGTAFEFAGGGNARRIPARPIDERRKDLFSHERDTARLYRTRRHRLCRRIKQRLKRFDPFWGVYLRPDRKIPRHVHRCAVFDFVCFADDLRKPYALQAVENKPHHSRRRTEHQFVIFIYQRIRIDRRIPCNLAEHVVVEGRVQKTLRTV